MPRNVTGGSGHKAQRNSEGSKAKHNRTRVDDLLDDIRTGENVKDIIIGRVTKRFGNGRMEVFYITEIDVNNPRYDGTLAEEDKPRRFEYRAETMNVPLCGALKGKGKKNVWVDVDSVVMIVETGLSGVPHEIVAVFLPEQVSRLRKLKPDMDDRLFAKSTDDLTKAESMFEFSEDADVDVDAI